MLCLDTNTMYRISVTGHRELLHSEDEIKKQFIEYLVQKKEEHGEISVNTGMAIGFDLLTAEICLTQNIPYIAALPFKDHLKNNEIFNLLKQQAQQIVIVSEGGYEKWKYFKRDKWLVENCDGLYAYLIKDGKSGTRTTVEVALEMKKEITYFQR